MKSTVKTLAVMGVMIALSVVLSRFLGFYIGDTIRISFGDLPIMLAGLWTGPIAGMIVGAAADILGSTVFSALGWYPPITAAPVLLGLISGLLRFLVIKRDGRLWRIAAVFGAAQLAASVLYMSFALSRMTGTPYLTVLAGRLPVNIIMAAIFIALGWLLNKRIGGRLSVSLSDFRIGGMSYDEAISYIHSIDWRGSRLGLERTYELLRRLGDPQRSLRFVHIAGTNGKGSVSAMLSSMLRASGLKTGLYTSPYICSFEERMQINGRPIPKSALARLTSRVRAEADNMADPPTEFELITAIAMLYFFEKGCDIVVLEVGLGGEFDSTNVIEPPLAAVITSISYDHMAILGDTIGKIAHAKAGIIKEGSPACVYYGDSYEALSVIESACDERHVPLTVTDRSRITARSGSIHGVRFTMEPYGELFCPLAGLYQVDNALLAITAAEKLTEYVPKLSAKAIIKGLAGVEWPARFQLLSEKPVFILDGGHNMQGVSGAAATFREYFPGKKAILVTGILADKAVPEMTETLASIAERVITTAPDNPRAMDADKLADIFTSMGIPAENGGSPAQAAKKALALAGSDGIVLAVGSLYMAGDILREYGHGHCK